MDELRDDLGEVALCFLGAIPAGRVSRDEYEDVAYYTLLMVDRVMDIMEYPYPQMKHTVQARRSVGIGITNLAHYMATSGMSYKTLEGKNFMHRHAEMHSFYCHKASVRLAKEFGPCKWLNKTKYPDGWTPLKTYNRNVDSVHTQKLMFDWGGLEKDILQYGMRNSVLEATAPYESSSGASDTTNSLYPIRQMYVTKKSGKSKVIFAAPDSHIPEVRDAYEFAWDVPTKDLLDMYAIFQKFCGQGISADTYTDFSKYLNEKIPASTLTRNHYYATKMGVKALYYNNSRGGLTEKTGSVGTSIEYESSVVNDVVEDDEDDCEACKA